MSASGDPIEALAFTELVIACQVDGCRNIFEKSLEQPATDPVHEWSCSMARSARVGGWSADPAGRVLCPVHARAIPGKDEMRELIGRWHQFAAQSKEEIAAQFNDETRSLFAEFFTKSFDDTGLQGARWASADEFARYVLELRANERAWSRYLGDTILRAHDLMEEGRLDEAKQELRTFRDICPWLFFAGLAETQLQSLHD